MPKACRLAVLIAIATVTTPSWAKSRTSEMLAGQHIHIAAGETRDQDLVCIGCTIDIDGTLDGDVTLIGSHLGVNGRVTGDAVAIGAHVVLGEHANLGGDVVVLGGRLARVPGATIAGDIVAPGGSRAAATSGLMIAVVAALLLPLAIAGLLAALLAFAILGERRVATIGEAVQQHAGLAILAGAAACGIWVLFAHSPGVLHPAAWPLHLLLSFALLIAMVAGYTGLSFALGRRISRRSGALGMTMIGALVIAAIQMVPIIGWAVLVFCVLLALGGCILSGFGSGPNWLQQRGRPGPPTGAPVG
ncbi:MAG TPA: hypothetical protein VKB56_11125 [Terriglobales bacterium]|nr:hypothetical protein [Terriglobales bacterium]